jgi:hypothetical protein
MQGGARGLADPQQHDRVVISRLHDQYVDRVNISVAAPV